MKFMGKLLKQLRFHLAKYRKTFTYKQKFKWMHIHTSPFFSLRIKICFIL